MQPTVVALCPFCAPDSSRVFLKLRHAFALWDGFPVTDGHALIVPYRHVPTWFDASDTERAELFAALDSVCAVIRERHGDVDGFNFGINIGTAAGQSVPHLHLHVIPRRHGDMPDPRGGVRHVIAGKGNYLRDLTPPPHIGIADVGSDLFKGLDTASGAQLTTGESHPLFPHLAADIAHATRVDIAVAFVMPSGVERLYPHFEDLLQRGGSLRLLTGDYLGVTDPDALQRLLDLQALHGDERIELRIFISSNTSFHPKAYLLTRDYTHSVAYVGSSNLSRSALTDGVEWNYRISPRDTPGLTLVRAAFEALFRHSQTIALDAAWLAGYRLRRPALLSDCAPLDVVIEPEATPPSPNLVQREALTALAATRIAGAKAGLVVLATGLGKTWLAAFDVAAAGAKRVLFVAHREEILDQALATFRRIQPHATLGPYNGTKRAPDADIIFASIQTLSRQSHLDRFARTAFDYIVVDEFHHAAAATYRRLIDHFDPDFLLALTATPERTDGGDLLGLCGENLVYRCGVPRGIALELLCAYQYFGVPDGVDYRNIPWKSTRFDEVELTKKVATQRRADNILDQWRKRGGDRTIAFCVSQTHSNFMKQHFTKAGVPCASVHSGPGADSRSLSLEQLAAGDLKVVFAVDMFNEGVDVPTIDTVMMLRPTESAIVWLQQFGRGLRKLGDKRVTVIDYIGNHRSFLLKVRALLDVQGGGDRSLLAAIQAVKTGEHELPPGCSVTYDVETIDILRALLRGVDGEIDALRAHYTDFRDRRGQRPTASEMFHDGYLPRTARTEYGSWFGFVAAMESTAIGGSVSRPDSFDLSSPAGGFLCALEITSMTKSYKMLVLQAMLNTNTFGGDGIHIDALTQEFQRLAKRTPLLRTDVGPAFDDLIALGKHIETNPIAAWTGKSTSTESKPATEAWFTYENSVLRFTKPIPPEALEPFQNAVRELTDWRLAEYLSRLSDNAITGGLVMRVKHSNGRPILFLPDRDQTPEIPPIGLHDVLIDGALHQASFVKIAINVVRPNGGNDNVLPKILRGWFGPSAGLPGTDFKVSCELTDGGWVWKPLGKVADDQLELFRRYSREQIPRLFGEQFKQATWNSGFVVITPENPKVICLLVTIDREGMSQQFQYKNRFLAPDLFQWQSQNQTRKDSKHGRLISEHEQRDVQVHLFVRAEKKIDGVPSAFLYCGQASFEKWNGDRPITVDWRLQNSLSVQLLSDFEP